MIMRQDMRRSACCYLYDIATGTAGHVCNVMHYVCIAITHNQGGLCTTIFFCQVYDVVSAITSTETCDMSTHVSTLMADFQRI